MNNTNIEHVTTWGSIPFGSSQVQVRHIAFWSCLVAWFLLTLLVTQVTAITAFAFNLTFLITLIVLSAPVRSITLTKMTSLFCAGGLAMANVLLVTLPLQTFLHNNPQLSSFLVVPLEEIAKMVPIICTLWFGRRFGTWTLGASDLLLLGAAVGAGFGFVVDSFAHKSTTVNHLFVLLPNAELINGQVNCGHAIWSSLAAGTMGLALLLYNRRLLVSILAPLGFAVALFDHVTSSYIQTPGAGAWLTTTLSFLTAHGFVAVTLFVLIVIACVLTDLWVQISALPKAPEFKILRRKERKERLDELWDAILDTRRLAYAYFRYKNMSSKYYPILRPADLALTVAILSKRLINRFVGTDYVDLALTNAGMQPSILQTQSNAIVGNSTISRRFDLTDKYEVLGEIGTGGMGVIYRGKHRITGANVAIKILHSHHSSNKSLSQRFEQEARTATTLQHPNIVVVHDFGVTEQDVAYLVMEWLEGPNLEVVLKNDARLTLTRFLNIFMQCTSALSHSHRRGVIHRDIKPSNIILVTDEEAEDRVKIVDFGIAKVVATDETQENMSLTQTGEVLGSPKFMSPEQCMGKPLDHRTDIYSLGCVMYESLLGAPTLSADNQAQMFYKHMFEMPARPTVVFPQLEMAELMEPLLFKALQKDPAQRYATMEELENDLKRVKTAHVWSK